MIAPVAVIVGELWREGTITAAHEHFATGMVRDFLRQMPRQYADDERGTVLVVATPSGQLHEMGALMVSALAANLGWRVTHLGASLPAAEGAQALALSLVYPEDDPELGRDLELDAPTAAKRCGTARGVVKGYRGVLERMGAFSVEELADLASVLDEVRASGAQNRNDNRTL